MKEHQHISMIYGILLTIGVLLCLGAIVFIPIDTYSSDEYSDKTELIPTATKTLNEDVREFHFRNINWKQYGTCLHFISSHQEIKVKADDELIFERCAVETIWGHSTGFAWEFIEIPPDTKDVTVTVTACYPAVRNMSIDFYQGTSVNMFRDVFHQEGFNEIISFLNVCLGFILLIYGAVTRKRTHIGKSIFYLGIFTIFLGIWSLSENGITAVLFEKRAACSFAGFVSLAMVGTPFILFIRSYLQTEDKYLHKILLGLNLLDIILVLQLQIFGIADMKQTVSMIHVAMMLSLLYLPVSLVHIVRNHLINRRFWVTICSLLCLSIPLGFSLIMYYTGSHNVDSYGNIFFFVFIAIFAGDVSLSAMKEIDAGKKAAIYQELAEKDLLTDCYNRNAYRNDTSAWKDLQDVLLLTCDLNNLKQCNDTLGHAYGDQYITDSAAILRKIFGKYGKVYRIGGDEFCIIIPNGSKCNINQLLDDLIEEERIYNLTSPVIHLQIASGYAVFDPKTDTTMEDIRNRADERMYQNKKALKTLKII